MTRPARCRSPRSAVRDPRLALVATAVLAVSGISVLSRPPVAAAADCATATGADEETGDRQTCRNDRRRDGRNDRRTTPAPTDADQAEQTDQPEPTDQPEQTDQPDETSTSTSTSTSTEAPANDLAILGNTCDGSDLERHVGLQEGDRCVTTQFGEVGDAENNPALLITSAPSDVQAGEPFELTVSTRNLVRDRFLPAAQGGYYKESSFLDADGLVRGHFHTACRLLADQDTAPDPAPAPAFFVATEDGGGGRSPDTVTVRIAGLAEPGEAQCAVWAGDGSHRIPMMQRANQIPALDMVRITVR